jgi:hypothetical protein
MLNFGGLEEIAVFCLTPLEHAACILIEFRAFFPKLGIFQHHMVRILLGPRTNTQPRCNRTKFLMTELINLCSFSALSYEFASIRRSDVSASSPRERKIGPLPNETAHIYARLQAYRRGGGWEDFPPSVAGQCSMRRTVRSSVSSTSLDIVQISAEHIKHRTERCCRARSA